MKAELAFGKKNLNFKYHRNTVTITSRQMYGVRLRVRSGLLVRALHMAENLLLYISEGKMKPSKEHVQSPCIEICV